MLKASDTLACRPGTASCREARGTWLYLNVLACSLYLEAKGSGDLEGRLHYLNKAPGAHPIPL